MDTDTPPMSSAIGMSIHLGRLRPVGQPVVLAWPHHGELSVYPSHFHPVAHGFRPPHVTRTGKQEIICDKWWITFFPHEMGVSEYRSVFGPDALQRQKFTRRQTPQGLRHQAQTVGRRAKGPNAQPAFLSVYWTASAFVTGSGSGGRAGHRIFAKASATALPIVGRSATSKL